MNWNHQRPLADFDNEISLIRTKYNLIGVSQMMTIDTFIFETEEEAHAAFIEFEQIRSTEDGAIQGWWYGREAFDEAKEIYERETGYTILVYWI